MPHFCAVHLDLDLPRDVAAEVEAVQREDPEMLARMLRYCVLRKTIFRALVAEGPPQASGRA